MSDLDARLAAAKAAKAEIEKRRAKSAEERASVDAVAQAEREVKELAALEKFEEEIGPLGTHLAIVETSAGRVILKRPAVAVFRRFQDKGDFKSQALAMLVDPCVVYPDKSAFDTLCEELPAVLTVCADAVCMLAGARAQSVSGK